MRARVKITPRQKGETRREERRITASRFNYRNDRTFLKHFFFSDQAVLF